jgi:PAS domain S-box-containing protein
VRCHLIRIASCRAAARFHVPFALCGDQLANGLSADAWTMRAAAISSAASMENPDSSPQNPGPSDATADREAPRERGDPPRRENGDAIPSPLPRTPGMVWTVDRELRFTFAVGAALEKLGLEPGQLIGTKLTKALRAEADSPVVAAHEKALQGESVSYETVWNGRTYLNQVDPSRDAEGAVHGVTGLAMDVSELKRKEDEVRDERGFLRHVLDADPNLIFAKDRDGRFTLANRAVASIYGTTPDDLLGRTDADFNPNDQEVQHFLEDDRAVIDSGRPKVIRAEPVTHAGTGKTRWFQTRKVPLELADGTRQVLGVSVDITDIRQTEERFRALFEQAPVGVAIYDREMRVTACNEKLLKLLGTTREHALGLDLRRLKDPRLLPTLRAPFDGRSAEYEGPYEATSGRKKFEWLSLRTLPLRDPEGRITEGVAMMEDISDRKEVEADVQVKMKRLAALRTIDRAITASMDLRVSLDVILDQIASQLEVDAVGIFLLSRKTQMLRWIAGRGFRVDNHHNEHLRLGEGFAGRAALERRMVSVPDIEVARDGLRAGYLEDEEGFRSYYAVPLIAKGEVKGVLEVLHRQHLQPDADWLEFLEALAGQTAIAVDNATLFDELRRNIDSLAHAYDTTIEGWSEALELRDRDVEGHTRRVTDTTFRLAEVFGVDEADLVHIRRGAMLHDIGKIGVPDGILRKKGPLTEEEWKIMKQHPKFAFDMLSKIDFLRPALDIPYCHHEKWDGTGYPRGLKATEIPLAARLFAVVDVWDALLSDRPYHAAWPEEKVREHVRALAGTHLDPQVVEIFLSMNW